MSPLHNDLNDDDYAFLSFSLDGEDGSDGGSRRRDAEKEEIKASPYFGGKAEAEGSGQTEDAGAGPKISDETEHFWDADAETAEALSAVQGLEEKLPIEHAENALGVSAHDRRFDFRARLIFTRHGFGHRLLGALRIILPVLAVAALFLHFTDLSGRLVWLLFGGFLLAGLAAALLLKLLRRPWKRSGEDMSLTFRADTAELDLPKICEEDFFFRHKPGTAAPAEGDGAWFDGDRLKLRLGLDAVADQAYHTGERTTLITFDVSFADRLLTLCIPDAALDRENRSELETEIFNRAARSLRAVRE